MLTFNFGEGKQVNFFWEGSKLSEKYGLRNSLGGGGGGEGFDYQPAAY